MVDVQDTTTAEAAAPAAPPPTIARRPSFLPMVAGGLIAAALGYGAAQVWPLAQGNDADLLLLQDQVAKLSETPAVTQDLSDRIAALEMVKAPDLAPLLTRVEALEQALTGLKTTSTVADPAALAVLQAQIDTLKKGGIPQAALEDVQAAFDTKLAEASRQLDAVKSEAEGIAQISARRAAILQLHAALDSGAPYVGALKALSGLDISDVLASHDAAGLPTLQGLRSAFPEAARAALDAALRANMGESWAERVQNFLMTQTGARSLTPREGSDPDAILSRAEAALSEGDLATALAEIGSLPAEAQAAMEGWITDAKLRVEAVLAVQNLSDAVGL